MLNPDPCFLFLAFFLMKFLTATPTRMDKKITNTRLSDSIMDDSYQLMARDGIDQPLEWPLRAISSATSFNPSRCSVTPVGLPVPSSHPMSL
jgi:hypothetical protein